ncbi:hypothetical protein JXA02_10915, partial [candidate division KSB1 bacterium]
MKRVKTRCYIPIIMLLLSLTSHANIGKMDARLGRLALHPEWMKSESPVLRKAGTTYLVRTIVTVRGSVREVQEYGGRVIFHHDDMAIVDIPLPMLNHIADLSSVVYMEMPAAAKARLDKSAEIVGAV